MPRRARDGDVDPIALHDERDQHERHAHDRRGDEQHESELHDRSAVQRQSAARRCHRSYGIAPARCGTRHMTTGARPCCTSSSVAPRSTTTGGEHAPRTEEIARSTARPRDRSTATDRSSDDPAIPCTASAARHTTRIAVKICRSRSVFVRARIRAPSSAPPSTPSITGNVSVGSMCPRAKEDAGARRRGDADHEVARRRRHLERQPHRLIHRQHLDDSRSDAEQRRENPGDEHEAEAGRHVAHGVRLLAVGGRIGRVQSKPRRPLVRCGQQRVLLARAGRPIRREQQDDAEQHGERARRNLPGHAAPISAPITVATSSRIPTRTFVNPSRT